MAAYGLKSDLQLYIVVSDKSEAEEEEYSFDCSESDYSFDRSDTFSSTNSDDVKVNTIFNSVGDGNIGAPTPPLTVLSGDPTKRYPPTKPSDMPFEVGQKVLCRDHSRDSWRKAVVKCVRPVRLTAEGASITRQFRDVQPLSPLDDNRRVWHGNLESNQRPKKKVRIRTTSVGGGQLRSPRSESTSIGGAYDTNSLDKIREDLEAMPSPPALIQLTSSEFIEDLKSEDGFFGVLFE